MPTPLTPSSPVGQRFARASSTLLPASPALAERRASSPLPRQVHSHHGDDEPAELTRAERLNGAGQKMTELRREGCLKALTEPQYESVVEAVNTAILRNEPSVLLELAPEALPDLSPFIACESTLDAGHRQGLPAANMRDLQAMRSQRFPVQVTMPRAEPEPEPEPALTAEGEKIKSTMLGNFRALAGMQSAAAVDMRLRINVKAALGSIETLRPGDRAVLLRQLAVSMSIMTPLAAGTLAAKSGELAVRVAQEPLGRDALLFNRRTTKAFKTISRHLDPDDADFNPETFNEKFQNVVSGQLRLIAAHAVASERLAMLAHLVACAEDLSHAWPQAAKRMTEALNSSELRLHAHRRRWHAERQQGPLDALNTALKDLLLAMTSAHTPLSAAREQPAA